MRRFYFVDRRHLKNSPSLGNTCHSRTEDDCENIRLPVVLQYCPLHRNIVTCKFYLDITDTISLLHPISEYQPTIL